MNQGKWVECARAGDITYTDKILVRKSEGIDRTDNKWNFEGTEINLNVARKFSSVMIRPICHDQTNYQELATKICLTVNSVTIQSQLYKNCTVQLY